MSSERKVKHVLDVLREETEKARTTGNYSYYQGEKRLEEAGRANANLGIISSYIAMASVGYYAFMFVFSSPPVRGIAALLCFSSIIANMIGFILGGLDIANGFKDKYSYSGAIVNGLLSFFWILVICGAFN